jgi:hypothetical protein
MWDEAKNGEPCLLKLKAREHKELPSSLSIVEVFEGGGRAYTVRVTCGHVGGDLGLCGSLFTERGEVYITVRKVRRHVGVPWELELVFVHFRES